MNRTSYALKIFSPPKIYLERLKLETLNLVCMLIVASTAFGRQIIHERGLAADIRTYELKTVPDRGVDRSCDPLKYLGGFWVFNHITGTAEPQVVTFCKQVR